MPPNQIRATPHLSGGRASFYDPNGNPVWIPYDNIDRAIESGFVPETTEQWTARRKQEKYSAPVASALLGAARGATLGASDLIFKAAGLGSEIDALREIDQTASSIGDLAGTIGGAVIAGPVALARKGAERVAAKLAERVATNRKLIKSTVDLAKSSLPSVAEGALIGVGEATKESIAGRADIGDAAEQIAEQAIRGAGWGLGFGVTGHVLSAIGKKFASRAREASGLSKLTGEERLAKRRELIGELEHYRAREKIMLSDSQKIVDAVKANNAADEWTRLVQQYANETTVIGRQAVKDRASAILGDVTTSLPDTTPLMLEMAIMENYGRLKGLAKKIWTDLGEEIIPSQSVSVGGSSRALLREAAYRTGGGLVGRVANHALQSRAGRALATKGIVIGEKVLPMTGRAVGVAVEKMALEDPEFLNDIRRYAAIDDYSQSGRQAIGSGLLAHDGNPDAMLQSMNDADLRHGSDRLPSMDETKSYMASLSIADPTIHRQAAKIGYSMSGMMDSSADRMADFEAERLQMLRESIPSEHDTRGIERFRRMLRASQDPRGILKRISNHDETKEDLIVLKRLYPETEARFVSFRNAVAKSEHLKSLSHGERRFVDAFMDSAERLAQFKQTSILQAAYQPMDRGMAGTKTPRSGFNIGGRSTSLQSMFQVSG